MDEVLGEIGRVLREELGMKRAVRRWNSSIRPRRRGG